MPSTYTLNNGIELIGTGEQSGTWGDTTNTNFELLDTALDGQVSVTLAATGSSGSPNTLPISDGASSNGRNRLVIFGDGGDLGGTAFVQLTPNDAEKIIYVRNNLSGSRSILLFQGTYNASNDYEVPAGTTAVVFFNGAGSGAVAANVFNNAFFDSLRLGSVSVDKILDEDNMASDDAAALATQQSIKAYVDSQVGTVDTLAEILANGNTTGANNIIVTAGQSITVDTISETTAANGVVIDGVTLKDGGATVTADVSFGANDKAIFGAGSDLQIYFNGSDGVINESVAGNLLIQGDNIYLQNSAATASYLRGVDGGAIDLRYAGNVKLATTSTGIDVTGTVTADGLTVDGTGVVGTFSSSNNNTVLRVKGNGATNGGAIGSTSSDDLVLLSGLTEKMRIDSSGNVGIGTTSPAYNLHVSGSEGILRLSSTSSGTNFDIGSGSAGQTFLFQRANSYMHFGTNNTERMRIDSSGNVGIGTSSPSALIHASGAAASGGAVEIRLEDTAASSNSRLMRTGSAYSYAGVGANETWLYHAGAGTINIGPDGAGAVKIVNNGAERMRIDSSGNLVVGKTSAGDTGAGITIQGAGKISAVRDGGISAKFVRETSDGSIVEFVKDTTTVGSIGTDSTDIYIGTGDTGIRFNDAVNGVLPYNTSTGQTDATLDLGFSTIRWRDLYLSNSVKVITATNGTSIIDLGDTSDSDIGRIAYDNSVDAMYFKTNNSEAMRIDSSGAVVINNSGGDAQLYLGGTGGSNRMYLARAGNNGFLWNVDSGYLVFATNNSEAMRIDSSGRLLLGNTDGSYASANADNIVMGDRTSSAESGITFGSTVASSLRFADAGAIQQGIIQYVHNDTVNTDYMNFYTAGSEAMRIDSSGNVGIGETNPQNTLHLSETSPQIRLEDTDATGYSKVSGSAANIYLQADEGNTVANTKIDLRVDGSVVAIFDGDGLKFNGDTAAANALDDYEEGTFTPTIANLTNLTGTASITRAIYTKVGNLCTIQVRISGLTITSASANSFFSATLPTAAAMDAAGSPAVMGVSRGTSSSASGIVSDYTGGNATQVQVLFLAETTASSGTFDIEYSLTYRTA